MKEYLKQFVIFIIAGIICLIIYIVGIAIYTRFSEDPIIFFASLVIGICAVVITCLFVYFVQKKFDAFTVTLIGFVYFLGIVLFAIFGPTFIDRSISYHISFLVVDEGKVNSEQMQEVFSDSIFKKRIHDAQVTGFVTMDSNGNLLPTKKAYIMHEILFPVGKMTNSLETYYDMKKEVEDAE